TGLTYSADVSSDPSKSPFPTTPGAYQTPDVFYRFTKVFAAKFNQTGGLSYSCILGNGSDSQSGPSIAVDAQGQAYISGGTRSAAFPTTPGAFQNQGGSDN